MRKFLLPLVLLFASCATLQKPSIQEAINDVANGVVAYFSGNTVAAGVDGLAAAAVIIRSFQKTPDAASPKAVLKTSWWSGLTTKALAQVPQILQKLTAQGMSPSAANETVAKGLDKAVATLSAP